MGRTIKNSIRESDLPVRYGGEEFAILALKADERQAEQLAERLRRSLPWSRTRDVAFQA